VIWANKVSYASRLDLIVASAILSVPSIFGFHTLLADVSVHLERFVEIDRARHGMCPLFLKASAYLNRAALGSVRLRSSRQLDLETARRRLGAVLPRADQDARSGEVLNLSRFCNVRPLMKDQ
jgi:hypothetical protein